ncbi:hypothetical protein [Haloarchaeobius iranensis]|uniref:Uncharacterized protein n=1 Tax=Haloarchaeobius iranensis TaxID=996166 RepID=A0A1G9W768_9EURY|nr:hypothetical protein [Haloarchaeobius iranensis]SDM80384.1 hypothetical protein SAMN05192554_107198 [Haloarchaeobius iranensis]
MASLKNASTSRYFYLLRVDREHHRTDDEPDRCDYCGDTITEQHQRCPALDYGGCLP